MKFWLPALTGIKKRLDDNLIEQLVSPGFFIEAEAKPYAKVPDKKGYLIVPQDGEAPILVIQPGVAFSEKFNYVLRAKVGETSVEALQNALASGKWEQHPSLKKIPKEPVDFASEIAKIISSWQNAFTFVKKDPALEVNGLRSPQIGAVHAALAHWTTSNRPATIVMPTGTGKTETMLSILVANQCSKLLVVVPTDALRNQLAEKFLTLGILKSIGAVAGKAQYPIVGVLKHRPTDSDAVDEFFSKCNVIVTTMQIAGQCSEDVQTRMAHLCPYLFIDEAHHIGAQTWRNFKAKFAAGYVLQFTATPFRNDGVRVEGKPIYTFPLKQALQEGYFKSIQYEPIMVFDSKDFDKAIAERAVKQLREDLAQGFDHILMARVDSIERAEEVFELYKEYSEFNPVQIHTGIKSVTKRAEIRRQIINKQSRIIVCVDMLGEGFDLPELKIAAFHDIRKSLAVTLQLAGRFTRDWGLTSAAAIITILPVLIFFLLLQRRFIEGLQGPVATPASAPPSIAPRVHTEHADGRTGLFE